MRVLVAGSVVTRQILIDEQSQISLDLDAEHGNAGSGTFPMPDPSMADGWVDGRSFRVQVGVANHDVLRGFIEEVDTERGTAEVGRRLQVLRIADANRLFHGVAKAVWKRPAETDRARLLAFAALYLTGIDTSWVLTGEDVSVPAHTYESNDLGQELVNDMITASGKVLFIDSQYHLHYHRPNEGHVAGLTVTDVNPDWATSFPAQEPRRAIDSIDLANRIIGKDGSGHRYTVSDATSIAAHNADGLHHDSVIDISGVHTLAELQIHINQALADLKDGRSTYEFTLGPLTDEQLALIGEGYQITITSKVLGLTAAVKRIAHMTVTYEGENLWFAKLEVERGKRLKKNPHLDRRAEIAARALRTANADIVGNVSTSNGVNYGWWELGGVGTAAWAPGSWLAGQINWPEAPCGVGAGAWHNRYDTERWYEFVAPADNSYIGATVVIQGTPVHNTPGWWYGVTQTAYAAGVTPLGSATKIGDGDPGMNTATYFIPRNAITWGATNYLVLSPSWQIASGMNLCDDGSFTGAWAASGGGYYNAASTFVQISFMKFNDGTVGIANWVPPAEIPNGATRTFTLIGWSGKGSPEAMVNSTIISTNALVYDRGAYTVTLPWAPPYGAQPLFKYAVATED